MVWSFSRDHGLPGWAVLSQVDSRSTIPLAAIALVTTARCLLSLINVGPCRVNRSFWGPEANGWPSTSGHTSHSVVKNHAAV
ncbi:aab92707-8797-4559-815d-6fdecb3db6f6-CDS [Sclerotinia trifoliorum]|uniref:Aab92707-8797-4559-815d-6fdecb3db6f6-CDS n=1 Tax=Sclerotinia trifoliorum TaxID=28548 RepID=A0A8H2VZZ2_9HELO|nr:aab92707-8797-4559-815d-6fdecb3db6f6-CDS [Sclerotinia trifoliorum]